MCFCYGCGKEICECSFEDDEDEDEIMEDAPSVITGAAK